MKRLYLKIFIFLIPILIVVAAIPLDRRLQYEGLKNDCSYHGLWFYDRLFENKKPVDIAFLGSSQSLNGIDDKIIERELSHTKLKVANFGYCRYGMNLYFVVLKEILKTKKPHTIIIEVREDENRYSHPVFPFIGESRDVLLANPLFNKDLPVDIYKHLAFKIQIIQEMSFKKRELFYPSNEEFGFSPNYDTASDEVLKAGEISAHNLAPELKDYERNFHMMFPRIYLEKISALCEKNNIKMYFLFLPGYGMPETIVRPKEYFTYSKYGPVIIPPRYIFTKKDNWFDSKHLNLAGAEELSKWLGKELDSRIGKK